MDKVEVKKMFFIKDLEQIIVHLNTFDWEFSNFGNVILNISDKNINMVYMGCVNNNGEPAMILNFPQDSTWTIQDVEMLYINQKDICTVERKN